MLPPAQRVPPPGRPFLRIRGGARPASGGGTEDPAACPSRRARSGHDDTHGDGSGGRARARAPRGSHPRGHPRREGDTAARGRARGRRAGERHPRDLDRGAAGAGVALAGADRAGPRRLLLLRRGGEPVRAGRPQRRADRAVLAGPRRRRPGPARSGDAAPGRRAASPGAPGPGRGPRSGVAAVLLGVRPPDRARRDPAGGPRALRRGAAPPPGSAPRRSCRSAP